MTEEQSPETPQETPTPQGDDLPIDPVLRLWTDLANDVGLEMGVTLSVGGSLISGRLVGWTTYTEAVIEQIEEENGETALSRLLKRELDQEQEIREARERGDRTDEELFPRHIHLLDARVYHPGGAPIPTGKKTVPWRIKLTAVDGFTYGMLGSSPSAP